MCPPSADEPTNGVNGTNGHANGTNGHDGADMTPVISEHNPHAHHKSPYAPVGDFLSNVSRFKIIESTLREGEQFANGKSASRFVQTTLN